MANVEKISVALTAEQLGALRSAVDSGEYATTSEIVREAVRDWQAKRQLREEDLKRLRQLWAQGKASGPARSLDLAGVRRDARRRLAKSRKA
ncbi:MAG TPA: type II toxin-antitoxin system ParD family antitoxin [Xanthobacteraceae bacterium]